MLAVSAPNITTVTAANFDTGETRVEAETRFFRDAFGLDFDKAFAQRWGAKADPLLPEVSHPPLPLSVSWATSLPLATFSYRHAAPVGSSNGVVTADATDSFLPRALATLYPLEDLNPDAVLETYRKGLLLPPNATQGLPADARLPALAVDEVPAGNTQRRACNLSKLPELRTKLPGYEPSLDYFDLALPTSDLATPGVSWSQQLKRSRVSCETLALSQAYDVRHNDLASTWAKASSGGYAFETMTGRRAFNAANANRICEWVEYVDRDGDTHLSGLNFHGRPLVEAVQVAGVWKIAETLYNADSNVLSQRRTVSQSRWQPDSGDTRYAYHEEPISPHSLGTTRPFHWMRRANVIRIEVRPRGGRVGDEVEGTTRLEASRGRYVAFAYEPFFNQVRLVESGSINSLLQDEPSSRTSMVFDYQEFGDESEVQSMLARAQLWGAGLPVNRGVLDPRRPARIWWDAQQLQIALLGTDVNGDGNFSALGVPVRVLQEGLNGAKEFTAVSWSASGRPMRIDSPGGTRTEFRYYPLAAGPSGQRGSAAGSSTSSGFAGMLASVRYSRTAWLGSGPVGAGCAQLPPEYRFLLQSCGANVGAQLEALGLSSQVVADIVAASNGFTAHIDYNELGETRDVKQYSGESLRFVRDTDGREVRSELRAPDGSLHSAALVTRNGFMQPSRTARFDAAGNSLGVVFREYDDEDKLLSECAQTAANDCTSAGGSGGVRTSWVYTREGSVFRSVDPEGLVTEYSHDERKWVTSTRQLSPQPDDAPRATASFRDDDGNVTREVFGSAAGSTLEATSTYDGLNRVRQRTETTGTVWNLRYSKRDVVTSRTHDGLAPWREGFLYDDFARLSQVTKNGVTTTQLSRVPGGEVFSRTGDGRSPSYVSTDALGRAVWGADSLGNQVVATESRGGAAHVMTQSRVRVNGSSPLTTGTEAQLDALGLPVIVREYGRGVSRTTELTRNASGFLLKVRTPDTAETQAEYDFLGRMLTLQQPAQFGSGATDFETSRYSYNKRGQLETQVDPKLETTVQLYTGFGEPKRKTLPISTPQVSQWQYDELGRRTRYTVNGRVNLGYEYGADGRLSRIVRGAPGSDAPELQTYAYDELGRVLSATRFNLDASAAVTARDRAVTTTRTYDDLARQYTEETAVGRFAPRTVQTNWTVAGSSWRRRVLLPDGRTTETRFDGQGRAEQLQRANGKTTDFTWVDELLEGESSTSSAVGSFERRVSFDDFAQPERIETRTGTTGALALRVDLRRDIMGRIAESASTFNTPSGAVESWRGYVYDSMGRLTVLRESSALPSQLLVTPNVTTQHAGTAVESNFASKRWAYEREPKVGSLLSITAERFSQVGTLTPPRFQAAPREGGYQLTTYSPGNGPQRQVTHDQAGRMTSDGTQGFVFDDLGELARLTDTAGNTTETYLYDSQSRLVATVSAAGTQGDVYVYDGAQMVQAYNETGVQLWNATWGPGLDHLLSFEKRGSEYFALDDGKGSVVGWVDATTRQVVATALYTPEGRGTYIDESLRSTAGYSPCDEKNDVRCGGNHIGIPFGFHSAFASKSSGLLYFRNRWYSPETAQWLSQDPLDAVDSFDLYAFNAFDSVNNIDPFGLNATSVVSRRTTEDEQRECMAQGLSAADCSEITVIGGESTGASAASPEAASCKGAICESMGSAGQSDGRLSLNGVLMREIEGGIDQSKPVRLALRLYWSHSGGERATHFAEGMWAKAKLLLPGAEWNADDRQSFEKASLLLALAGVAGSAGPNGMSPAYTTVGGQIGGGVGTLGEFGRLVAMSARTDPKKHPSRLKEKVGKTEIDWPSRPHANETPGHWETIVDVALKMAKSGKYRKIYVNKGINNELGPGAAKPNNRPDVWGVRWDGKIDQVEVLSRSDKEYIIQERMLETQEMLDVEGFMRLLAVDPALVPK